MNNCDLCNDDGWDCRYCGAIDLSDSTIAVLTNALRFYGDPKTWSGMVMESPGPLYADYNGDRAREALKKAGLK